MFWYFIVGCIGLVWGYAMGYVVRIKSTTDIGQQIINVSNIIGLSIILKCIEEYSYANRTKIKALMMEGTTRDDEKYRLLKRNQQKIMDNFKINSINSLIRLHSGVYNKVLPYHDWQSAMVFLKENKELVFLFRKGVEK